MRPRAPVTRPKAIPVSPSPGGSITAPRRLSSLSPPNADDTVDAPVSDQLRHPIGPVVVPTAPEAAQERRDASVATSPLLSRYEGQQLHYSPQPLREPESHMVSRVDCATSYSPVQQQQQPLASPSPRRSSSAQAPLAGATPVFVGWSSSDAHTGHTPSVKEAAAPIRLVAAPKVATPKASASGHHTMPHPSYADGYFRPLRSASMGHRSPSHGSVSMATGISVSRSTAPTDSQGFVLIDRRGSGRARASMEPRVEPGFPRLEVVEVEDDEPVGAADHSHQSATTHWHAGGHGTPSLMRRKGASRPPSPPSPQSPAHCFVEVDELSPAPSERNSGMKRGAVEAQQPRRRAEWTQQVRRRDAADGGQGRSLSSVASSVPIEMDDVVPASSPPPASSRQQQWPTQRRATQLTQENMASVLHQQSMAVATQQQDQEQERLAAQPVRVVAAIPVVMGAVSDAAVPVASIVPPVAPTAEKSPSVSLVSAARPTSGTAQPLSQKAPSLPLASPPPQAQNVSEQQDNAQRSSAGPAGQDVPFLDQERLRVMEEAAKIEAELAAMGQAGWPVYSCEAKPIHSGRQPQPQLTSTQTQGQNQTASTEENLRRIGRERAEGMSSLQKLLRKAVSTAPSPASSAVATPFVSPIKPVASANVSVSVTHSHAHDDQIVRRSMTKLQALAYQEGLGHDGSPQSHPTKRQEGKSAVAESTSDASTLMECMRRAYAARQMRETAEAAHAAAAEHPSAADASSSADPPQPSRPLRADPPQPSRPLRAETQPGSQDLPPAFGSVLASLSRPHQAAHRTAPPSLDRVHQLARSLRPYTRLLLSSLIRGDRNMSGAASVDACAEAANAVLSHGSPSKASSRGAFVTGEDVRAMLVATGEGERIGGSVPYATFVSSVVELAS